MAKPGLLTTKTKFTNLNSMKKIISLLVSFLLITSAFAQLGSGVKNSIMQGKAYDKAKTITNTNHNYIATQFLKDEAFRHNCPNVNKFCKLKSELIKTGRKDPNGNDIIYVQIKSDDGKQQYMLKPDFEDFPMTYKCFSVAADQVYRPDKLIRPGKNYLKKTNMFLVANNGATFTYAERVRDTDDDRFFVKSLKEGDEDLLLLKNYLNKYERNVDYQNADYEAFVKKNHARLYTEAQNMWKAALALNDKILTNANVKKYEKLMNEIQSGAYFMLSSSGNRFDSLKIDFKKDAAGKLTELKMHFPYIDNEYYDKEKFYLTVAKGANGFFELSQKTDFIDLIGNAYNAKRLLIPFEGRLIILSGGGQYPYSIEYIITNDLTDQLAHNILEGDLYFKHKLWAYDVQSYNLPDHPSGTDKTLYGEWWIKANFETEYKYEQDMIYFSNFLTKKYLPAILAK